MLQKQLNQGKELEIQKQIDLHRLQKQFEEKQRELELADYEQKRKEAAF
jgi:hypothetical protein